MDRLKREGNPPTGQLASPIPQYKGATEWEILQGEGGASYVKDKDAIAKLEQARALLAGVATEAKLEQARVLLQSVAGKDFATQATLAQVKSELELVKAELATIKANQLSGDQKVQLSGTIAKPHVFFDNQEVRATGIILGTSQTVNSKGITILVRNALDAEISIVVLLAPNNHSLLRSVVWDGERFRELLLPDAVKIPANQNRWFILNTYYTFLDTLTVDKMNIGIQPSTEPTTGFVTILGFTKEVS